jgi:pimeloyl-ACP methyl ester carboxylesterase
MSIQKHEAAYFCHGMPGSEDDAKLLQNVDDKVQLIAPNLLNTRSADLMSGVLKQFDERTEGFADGQINVVGFSIGAMVAIKIAVARPRRVGRLTLISPAAPLSLGNFLPEMAGKPVFTLAMKHPKALKLLTRVQGLLSSVAPNFLIKQLFAKCGKAESALIDDPSFRTVIRHGFSNSFQQHPDAYVGFIRSYVEDWSADLNRVNCPVDLWHGMHDTWSPIAMSQKLGDSFSTSAHVSLIQDTEHYSTLTRAHLTSLNPESDC